MKFEWVLVITVEFCSPKRGLCQQMEALPRHGWSMAGSKTRNYKRLWISYLHTKNAHRTYDRPLIRASLRDSVAK